ncbi:MAG TPA: hypothetical protein ENN43_09130 [bacterium]|nr:hypothetical protein [bacterium]
MRGSVPDLIREINRAEYITVLTGAGISTLCGLPDFRGDIQNPVWEKYPQEKVFNSDVLRRSPEIFFGFLKEILIKDYTPCVAHHVIKNLEDAGKVKAVITQNIDGLHHLAGSKHIYELHGSIYKNYCVACGRPAGYEEFAALVREKTVPYCACGGFIRPDVVFFGEMLPEEDLKMAVYHASRSDLILVVGTSLLVQPAAYMPVYTLKNGGKLALINKGETYIDDRASLKLDDIKEVFEELNRSYGAGGV